MTIDRNDEDIARARATVIPDIPKLLGAADKLATLVEHYAVGIRRTDESMIEGRNRLQREMWQAVIVYRLARNHGR